ncbi:hypothetical protein [Streptomyces gilvus]|uniref:hypothetical protein n=1 Tax=Streptomyces gilvus TaxID=2920937 RepID=UPI001F0F6BF4|nr:hypothetical protein [Streptomyces sp. CME 23]MCH5671456.1 hypothetical protein [Streptomyces sp. CME 23]
MSPTSAAARGVGLRPLRAGVFAAVCVVTTAFGHALMSGDLLPWWALGAAYTGTATAAWWLTARERGVLTVVGATTAVQALLHLWFDLTHMLVRMPSGEPARASVSDMDHAMALSGSGMVMHMGHADMAMAPVGPARAASDLSAGSVLMHQGSAGMFLAHLLAAVVCGLWLWRGETAVHRLGRALAVMLLAPLRRVRRLLAGRVAVRRARVARPAAVTAQAPLAASAALRHTVIRRGPPRAASAVLRPSTTGPLSAAPL